MCFFDTTHTLRVMKRYDETLQDSADKISRVKQLEWESLYTTSQVSTKKGSHQAIRLINI